ncbi:MAG TPA: tryptophan--tRNA ligase [Spirochaetota bacterium]|nr:tryptophan--tRNA ligase [Spirochaetota bacterium]HPI91062.1 tryptophan--tRNA ligase [Spirochaetota bacterium]HPR49969.1 tryptophan--tRNA ligase [Spirochaetota bacterium]
MKRVLSGIQPSGTLHIGNYFAMMKPMIELQKTNELFCFIVNYHAMTTIIQGEQLRENTLNAAIDFLSLGLDPEKTFFWVQSDVPEVTELSWILSCHTSLGLLERSHSYKDKLARGITPNSGLFTYPVLMAADILLYNADIIPVGKDQKQHVEITRDIAIRFNNTYGDIFTIPEPKIDDDIAVIPGTDGQKMSKSYDNTINIFEDEKQLKKKIMKIVTDSTPVEDPKDPEKCTIFSLYRLFGSENQVEDLKQRYVKGGTGYGEVKKELLALVLEYFRPYREKREQYLKDKGEVLNILKKGAEKTRAVAIPTLDRVKRAVGLIYY